MGIWCFIYLVISFFFFFLGSGGGGGRGGIFREQGYITKDQGEQMLNCTFQEHGNVQGGPFSRKTYLISMDQWCSI